MHLCFRMFSKCSFQFTFARVAPRRANCSCASRRDALIHLHFPCASRRDALNAIYFAESCGAFASASHPPTLLLPARPPAHPPTLMTIGGPRPYHRDLGVRVPTQFFGGPLSIFCWIIWVQPFCVFGRSLPTFLFLPDSGLAILFLRRITAHYLPDLSLAMLCTDCDDLVAIITTLLVPLCVALQGPRSKMVNKQKNHATHMQRIHGSHHTRTCHT